MYLLAWKFGLVYGACVFGFFSFIPYYATVAYNMSAGESGFILTPRSLSMAVMSAISSFFLIRFGYRRPMIIGTVFLSLSLFLTSAGFHNVRLMGLHVSNLVLMGSFVLIAGLGGGLAAPASNNAALDLIPGKVAVVAGIRGMFRQMGGVFGAAIIVLALSHFEDKAAGAQTVFFYMACLMLAVIPAIFLIPDIARQRRRAETEGEQTQEGMAVAEGDDNGAHPP